VDFVADRFPKKLQRFLIFVNLLLSLVFVLVVFYYESKMTLAVRGSTFVVMKISKALCYVGIPLACLLFAVFIVEKIIRQVRRDRPPIERDR
jgi:TRAP-type C4-dicarboxylate transport system permease small subunit